MVRSVAISGGATGQFVPEVPEWVIKSGEHEKEVILTETVCWDGVTGVVPLTHAQHTIPVLITWNVVALRHLRR